MTNRFLVGLSVLMLASVPALAAEEAGKTTGTLDSWMRMGDQLAADPPAGGDKSAPKVEAAPNSAPPLPLHCFEGYSGGFITPMAYIANLDTCNGFLGKPVVSYSFMAMGHKTLQALVVTQPFWKRFEFGYALNYFNVGTLFDDAWVWVPQLERYLDLGRDNVYLHHFNLRGIIIMENSFGLPLPQLTGGVHFKRNHGINQMDHALGGLLEDIGYDTDCGVDFTLTASKTFPELVFGRPLILTLGLRWSRAAQVGLLGFGRGPCATTIECSAAYLPTDWLMLCYEYREKDNPYHELGHIIGREEDWHALSVTWIVNEHLTVSGVYGILGTIANTNSDHSLAVQAKWEL